MALWPCWWPLHYRPPHGPISARTGVLLNEGVPIMEEWRRGVVLCAVAEERELFPREWRGLVAVDEDLVQADHPYHVCQFGGPSDPCTLVPDVWYPFTSGGACASRDGWYARVWWKLAMAILGRRRANFWVAACWATLWSGGGGGPSTYRPLQVGAEGMEITMGYRRPRDQ